MEGKGISDGFLFAALLWSNVNAEWQRRLDTGEKSIPVNSCRRVARTKKLLLLQPKTPLPLHQMTRTMEKVPVVTMTTMMTWKNCDEGSE